MTYDEIQALGYSIHFIQFTQYMQGRRVSFILAA